MKIEVKTPEKIDVSGTYWLFAIIYAFMKWGFWQGMLSIILPIYPLIDLVQFIINITS